MFICFTASADLGMKTEDDEPFQRRDSRSSIRSSALSKHLGIMEDKLYHRRHTQSSTSHPLQPGHSEQASTSNIMARRMAPPEKVPKPKIKSETKFVKNLLLEGRV